MGLGTFLKFMERILMCAWIWEHCPQFSYSESCSSSFTFFHSLQIKASFVRGLPLILESSDSVSNLSVLLNELHPTKTLTCREQGSVLSGGRKESTGIENTGLRNWKSQCSNPRSVFYGLCDLWQVALSPQTKPQDHHLRTAC